MLQMASDLQAITCKSIKRSFSIYYFQCNKKNFDCKYFMEKSCAGKTNCKMLLQTFNISNRIT